MRGRRKAIGLIAVLVAAGAGALWWGSRLVSHDVGGPATRTSADETAATGATGATGGGGVPRSASGAGGDEAAPEDGGATPVTGGERGGVRRVATPTAFDGSGSAPDDGAAPAALPPLLEGPVEPTLERRTRRRRAALGTRPVDASGPLRLEVRLFADEDDRPLPGVTVTFYRQPDPFVAAEVVARGRTDGEGRLVLPHPGGCALVGRTHLEGRVPLTDDGISVPEDRSLLLEGRMPLGTPITGTLTREEDGEPVAGGEVRLIWKTNFARLRPYSEAEIASRSPVGPDGRFQVDAWFPDTGAALEIRAPGRATTYLDPHVGSLPHDLGQVELPPGATARGVVAAPDGSPGPRATVLLVCTDDWTPVEDPDPHASWEADVLGEVYLFPEYMFTHVVLAWSGEGGRYQADGLRAGSTYVAVALSPEAGCSTGVPDLEPEEGTVLAIPRLRMRAFGRLLVTVLGEDRMPVNGAEIDVIAEERLHVEEKGDGRYEIARCDPILVAATAEAPDGRFGPLQVLVRPGETTETTVVLAERTTYSGRVVDTSGAPVTGAKVWVHESSGRFLDPEGGDARVETDAEGRFVARGLRPGTYSVWVERDGFEKLKVRGIEIPAAERDFVLAGAAKIRVKLRVPEGGPRLTTVFLRRERPNWGGSLRWELLESVTARDGGVVLVENVPAGEQRIAVDARPYAAVIRDVELTPGGTADLGEVTLEPLLVLPGRVVDESGRPVEGVGVRVVSDLIAPYSDGHHTDADGRFTAELGEPGRAWAWLEKEGYAEVPVAVDVERDMDEVTLVLPRGIVVTGVAVDAEGAPLAERRIALRPLIRENATFLERNGGLTYVETDAEGRFSVRLVPGPHEYPSKGWFKETAVVDVHEGAELEIRAPHIPGE